MINTSEGSIKHYLEDIRHTAPLSIAEEQVLFKLAKKGNELARQKLISANMRFVLKVAMNFQNSKLTLADLISEGAIGLARAIDTYEVERGLKFISYAVWWIKAYITKAINETGDLIRLPANQNASLRKALKDTAHGGEMLEEHKILAELTQSHVSFDSPLADDSKSTYSDVLADESAPNPMTECEMKSINCLMDDLMSQLPDKEKTVIGSLYGINRPDTQTLREVGSYMKVSHERVRQLRDRALKRLRKNNSKEFLIAKKEALFDAVG